jgi:hypothetical protein
MKRAEVIALQDGSAASFRKMEVDIVGSSPEALPYPLCILAATL